MLIFLLCLFVIGRLNGLRPNVHKLRQRRARITDYAYSACLLWPSLVADYFTKPIVRMTNFNSSEQQNKHIIDTCLHPRPPLSLLPHGNHPISSLNGLLPELSTDDEAAGGAGTRVKIGSLLRMTLMVI